MDTAIPRTMMKLHSLAEAVKRFPGPISNRRVESAVGEAIAKCRTQRNFLERFNLRCDAVGVEMLVETGDTGSRHFDETHETGPIQRFLIKIALQLPHRTEPFE